MIDITFYGVRGSTPCSCDGTRMIGGNTACVLVTVAGEDPIILDLGTGLRYLGERLRKELGAQPFRGTALVSHLHWDHIQGLPFFAPVLGPGAELEIVGPRQEVGTLEEAFDSFLRPPAFPVRLSELPGDIRFAELSSGERRIGSVTVSSLEVAHTGITNAYRLQNGTGSVVYASDHQEPKDGSMRVPDELVEFCAGVDLLIHDAQFDAEEFAAKRDWGHSTVEYAAVVAREAQVKRLVLFHHDPLHDDAWIHEARERAQAIIPDIEVVVAAEGLTLRSGTDLLI